jgi:hypothetical protein
MTCRSYLRSPSFLRRLLPAMAPMPVFPARFPIGRRQLPAGGCQRTRLAAMGRDPGFRANNHRTPCETLSRPITAAGPWKLAAKCLLFNILAMIHLDIILWGKGLVSAPVFNILRGMMAGGGGVRPRVNCRLPAVSGLLRVRHCLQNGESLRVGAGQGETSLATAKARDSRKSSPSFWDNQFGSGALRAIPRITRWQRVG